MRILKGRQAVCKIMRWWRIKLLAVHKSNGSPSMRRPMKMWCLLAEKKQRRSMADVRSVWPTMRLKEAELKTADS